MDSETLKYHVINVIAVLIFSVLTALTVNQFIRYIITPEYNIKTKHYSGRNIQKNKKDFSDYNIIIESGFFKIADLTPQKDGEDTLVRTGSLDDLNLLGTITGPASIARALIQKKGEKDPRIFALYRINNDINSDVYGYTLVSINASKVYLKSGDSRYTLDMYGKKEGPGPSPSNPGDASGNSGTIKKTISRAEIKQNVLNNMDNALKGLRAGPYRENGEVAGYRLIKVRPYNILYKLGARNGDIVRRINGKKIDSTEKLYKMWEALKSDSRITADIERGGKIMTFEYNISE